MTLNKLPFFLKFPTSLKINSWEQYRQFADLADQGPAWVQTFVFRGQASASWELLPSLIRNLPKDIDEARALEIERYALRAFQAQAGLFSGQNDRDDFDNVLRWWVLMQHHGAPTRLLDWTESPYVAAYFAVMDRPEEDGVVWIANTGTIHENLPSKHTSVEEYLRISSSQDLFLRPDAPPHTLFMSGDRKNERMVPQRGLFSVSRNILGNHGKYFSELKPAIEGELICYKFVIPAAQKKPFARKLLALNVTANSLFPGLDGLGRSIREKIWLSNLDME